MQKPNKTIVQWQPRTVSKPAVDKSLIKSDPLTRSAECLRYFALCVEHWISPAGLVREWLRHNLLLAVLLAIPTFLVLPVLTATLWQVSLCSEMLTTIGGGLILLLVAFVVLKAFLKR